MAAAKTAKPKAKRKKKQYLVIVESPAKASTIKKFLGASYTIEASMGHVRDLPKSQLGVDIEHDFEPHYITIRGKGDLLAKLRKASKAADKVFLATDPDREGEAISWHLVHALNLSEEQYSRITFNEITEHAVKHSFDAAREIDMDLVDAQQARRVLDRVVGYSLSRLLWDKVKKGLSGGRVQSVALRLICDREEEIQSFIPEEYWSLDGMFASGKTKWKAAYIGANGTKEIPKCQAEMDQLVADIQKQSFTVAEVKKGSRIRRPFPPFTTSTLQQEASKYLNLTAQKTMMIAQQLYEGVEVKGEGTLGLVSYIRTDSVRISDEAYKDMKAWIEEQFGQAYLPAQRNVYKSKNKAQDAHEAIRPTYIHQTPEKLKESLSRDQYRLYKLIWERALASQMAPAEYDTQSVTLRGGAYEFRTAGSVIKFPGFLQVYDKVDEGEDNQKMVLVKEGEALALLSLDPQQHFTQPPARFSDASLIKTLEELGVGRPSTYAPTIATILNRYYVVKEKKLFYPTELGGIVNEIMREYFPDIVNVDFTAGMEEELDSVEEGKIPWKETIRKFYPIFLFYMKNAEEKLSKVELKDEVTDVICEKCGRNMVVKYGRYGKFLACPGFPECSNTKPLFEDAGVKCPKCGKRVLLKKTKKGRLYYGCEDHPEHCDFVSWNKPVEERCPKCGGYMVLKGTKHPKIVCADPACGFQKDAPEKEED